MSAVSLRLPDDLSRRLTLLAQRTGRSKTFYMKEAIAEYLEDQEDVYIAEQRLADFDAGRSIAVPLEEVMQRLGLEN